MAQTAVWQPFPRCGDIPLLLLAVLPYKPCKGFPVLLNVSLAEAPVPPKRRDSLESVGEREGFYQRVSQAPTNMKRFDELFAELQHKAATGDPHSDTVKVLAQGKHAIGKKILEEAGEVWMAAEYESREKTAEEISQLLYHIQVMMLACDLTLDDVYRYL